MDLLLDWVEPNGGSILLARNWTGLVDDAQLGSVAQDTDQDAGDRPAVEAESACPLYSVVIMQTNEGLKWAVRVALLVVASSYDHQ